MPTTPEPLREFLSHYSRGPELLRQAIDGLEPGALNRRPLGSDWSIRDIIMHLTDAELMAAGRLRMVIAVEEPAIQEWPDELFKRKLHYLWRDPEAALAVFQVVVYTNAELLQQCDAKTFERVGIHPERGRVSLGDLLEDRAKHLDEHIAQIASHRATL